MFKRSFMCYRETPLALSSTVLPPALVFVMVAIAMYVRLLLLSVPDRAGHGKNVKQQTAGI
jgi:hypothetical protein